VTINGKTENPVLEKGAFPTLTQLITFDVEPARDGDAAG
jgi:hypothetical protein